MRVGVGSSFDRGRFGALKRHAEARERDGRYNARFAHASHSGSDSSVHDQDGLRITTPAAQQSG